MNALTTDKFIAERKPSGDVWIATRSMKCVIVVPQQLREALAKVLWPDVELTEEEWIPNYNRPPYKVDYARRMGEPE